MSLNSNVISCVGAVVRKNSKILFVKQTYGQLKNMWTIPWGIIEMNTQNETPEQAAIRETMEEGGIESEIIGLIGIQNYTDKDNNQNVHFIFLCDYISGDPTPDYNETNKALFFDKNELKEIKGKCDEYCYWIANRVYDDNYNVLTPVEKNPYKPNYGFY
ncbi:MAG: NUDIX domain-containing protein [Nanoarchaeota archaeon]